MAERRVRIEVTGPTAEAAVALLCAREPALQRDLAAPLGSPAAGGELPSGEAVLDALTSAASASLDGVDLQLTVGPA